jgi:hypothetical protein
MEFHADKFTRSGSLMGRAIVVRRPRGSGTGTEKVPVPDDALAKMVKLVPAEIISFYTLEDTLIRANSMSSWMYLVAMILGAVLTPVHLRWATKNDTPALSSQYVLSTLAFLVWTNVIGAPFVALGWNFRSVALFLLPVLIVLGPFAVRADLGSRKAPEPGVDV